MKKSLIITLALLISTSSVLAIEDATEKKSLFSFFKKEKNEVVLKKDKKSTKVEELELPAVSSFRKPAQNFLTMSIEDCVSYAIAHNPNLSIAEQQIKAAKAGIGQQKASFAPRLTARINYNIEYP